MRAPMSRKRRILLILFGALAGLALLVTSQLVCISAYLAHGIAVETCPDGDVVQTVSVESYNLRRRVEGWVTVRAFGNYTTAAADGARAAEVVRGVDQELYFVKPGGEELALKPREGWKDGSASVALPEVPDGEYILRAKVSTPIGDTVQDVPLPVFAPAKVHVITDRPLYEPGNVVQFRAVALRAKDLAPLDGRPGRWIVTDPNGEVMLEEKSPAKELGIASGSFPLDKGAAEGDWRVAWSSGAAEDTVTFRVEPFSLPRFSIEASPAKPYYRANEKPVIRGKVRYSSGAPVRDAEVEIVWSINGSWPPPAEWMESTLPKRASTDASGGFELDLPRIPGDLRGKSTLFARLAATDPAKDRVEGSASVLLSEDAIAVSAVTELDDGLVQGFNNRIYLRVTSASGAVLSNTELTVKRAWEQNDKGIKAMTDEDGVASLQVDPGPPINVVIPPMPWRPPPRPPAIARTNAIDLITEDSPPLADLRAMDSWTPAIAPCTRFVESSESTQVGVRVDPTGAIDTVTHDGRPFSRCVAASLNGKRLAPTGKNRIYQIEFAGQSTLPTMAANINGTPFMPPPLEQALHVAALDARTCLPRNVESGMLPRMMLWKYDGKKREFSARFADDPDAEGTPSAAVAACAEAKLSKPSIAWPSARQLEEEGEEGTSESVAIGFARFTVDPAASDASMRPQATTMLGYELAITARTVATGEAKAEELGKTKLFISPGQIPYVRLRASTVLAEPGQEIEVAILRGPSFSGEIPEKLYLSHETGSIEGKVDPKTKTVKFAIPGDGQGWYALDFSNARALVYVKPRSDLVVSVKPGADTYAPGDTATLTVSTRSRGNGTAAAVGLFGVDSSLGQLTSLPGADDMARVRPKAEMRSSAFDVLDASALALGRIRGANAAAATVLRVASVPAYVDLDASVNASGQGTFDPIEPLTDHFYAALAELHDRTRDWEQTSPPGEQITPAVMAKLWNAALDACERKKISVDDAYGRRLRLHRLPADLLALTDPRAVVVDGTRLPEDIENWPAWVAKEKP